MPSTKNRGKLIGFERVLDAFEERTIFDLVASQLGVLFQQIAFAPGQLRRPRDVNRNEQIAPRAAAHVRHAASAQPVGRAGLRPRDDRNFDRAVDRVYRDRSAERRLRERDRDVQEQLRTVAPEARMLREAEIDVQIPGRTAARPRFAAARDADAASLVDARGNLDGQRPRAFDAAVTAALLAGRGDELAVAATFGTCGLRDERAEGRLPRAPRDAASTATLAACRTGSGTRTARVTGFAGREMMERDLALGATIRFFEGDLQVVAQVRAALRSGRAGWAGTRTKKHVEDVAKSVGRGERTEATRSAGA